MWWPFRSTADTTSSAEGMSRTSSATATASSSSELTLDERLLRVTSEDIKAVRVSDVQRMRATLTDADLRLAIQMMLERNQFGAIIAVAPATALAVAATDIKPSQLAVTGSLMKEQMSLLYAVLPFVTESFLATMGSSCTTAVEAIEVDPATRKKQTL